MRIRATLRLQNAFAIETRNKLGLRQIEVAKLTGVSSQKISDLENLRFKSIGPADLRALAEFYNVPPTKLIPSKLMKKSMRNVFTLEQQIDPEHLLGLPQPLQLNCYTDDKTEQAEIHNLLRAAVDSLPLREGIAIKMSYGLDGYGPGTPEDIGRVLGVSRHRANQIRARGLRKLQDPSRSRKLARALWTEDNK